MCAPAAALELSKKDRAATESEVQALNAKIEQLNNERKELETAGEAKVPFSAPLGHCVLQLACLISLLRQSVMVCSLLFIVCVRGAVQRSELEMQVNKMKASLLHKQKKMDDAVAELEKVCASLFFVPMHVLTSHAHTSSVVISMPTASRSSRSFALTSHALLTPFNTAVQERRSKQGVRVRARARREQALVAAGSSHLRGPAR